MGIPITDTSAISKIPEWNNMITYNEVGNAARRNGAVYIVANATANVNKDPALGANKAFWARLTAKVFDQENNPTSATGGEHAVIDGDRWITYAGTPSGGFSGDTAPLARVRKGNNWTLVNSGMTVVADGDSWGTVDKNTSMVILEKHIDDAGKSDDAITLGFKNRAGSWKHAKLWEMPWGHVDHFQTNSDTRPGNSYNIVVHIPSAEHKKDRRYKVDWGCSWKVGTSNHDNEGHAYLALNNNSHASSGCFWTGAAISSYSLTGYTGGSFYYEHSVNSTTIDWKVFAKDNHNDGRVTSRYIIITDIGPI